MTTAAEPPTSSGAAVRLIPDDGPRLPPSDPDLLEVLDELLALEPLFHRPESTGTSRAAFERGTAPDFWETGASGRRYGRETVWAELARRYAETARDPWEVSEPRCRALGPGVVLLTYTLRQDERVTRRATVWERPEGTWRIAYHQGTEVSAAAPQDPA
jgi:hypothetical protein